MSDVRQKPLNVLIVEDESIPARYLQGIIEENDTFSVEAIVPNAQEALEAIESIHPSVVFMDILIEGGISGAELAVMIHHRYPETVIIFLTAYSNDEMMEYAVDAEAFAYLLKPYRPREIHATLRLAEARLRHHPPVSSPDWIDLSGGYRCRLEPFALSHDGAPISLSPNEMALMQILCTHPGDVIDRKVLLEQLAISDASLRALIYRLRKSTDEKLIESVKRYGYRVNVMT